MVRLARVFHPLGLFNVQAAGEEQSQTWSKVNMLYMHIAAYELNLLFTGNERVFDLLTELNCLIIDTYIEDIPQWLRLLWARPEVGATWPTSTLQYLAIFTWLCIVVLDYISQGNITFSYRLPHDSLASCVNTLTWAVVLPRSIIICSFIESLNYLHWGLWGGLSCSSPSNEA